MNYLQILADAYQGKGMAGFSADLQQELSKDREELARDGFTMIIEPLAGVEEKIYPGKDGSKMVKYSGNIFYAFRTPGGQYQAGPANMEAEITKADYERGSFVFFVDAGGTVIAWSDDLTGNSHGARMPRVNTGEWSSLIVMLPWIIVAALIVIGGFIYSSLTMSL